MSMSSLGDVRFQERMDLLASFMGAALPGVLAARSVMPDTEEYLPGQIDLEGNITKAVAAEIAIDVGRVAAAALLEYEELCEELRKEPA